MPDAKTVTIAERVQLLLDLEDIRELQARYCRAADRGYEGAGDSARGVAELFTEDGTWGDVQGRDAIEQLFDEFGGGIPLSVHMALNPLIEIDGDRATARWTGVIPVTLEGDNAVCIVGAYNEELARTPDGWRFTRLLFTPIIQAPGPARWGAEVVAQA